MLTLSCTRQSQEVSQQTKESHSDEIFTLTGQVLLEDSGSHLGVDVFAAGTSFLAITDEEGRYTIAGVPAGSYKIIARREGYEMKEIGALEIPEGKVDTSDVVRLPLVRLLRTKSPTPEIQLGGVVGVVALEEQIDPSGVLVRIKDTQFSNRTDESGM